MKQVKLFPVLILWVSVFGCRGGNRVTGPPGYEIPPPTDLRIIYPHNEYERLVGDGVILTVEAKVLKLLSSTPWPPPPEDISRVECFVEGRLAVRLGPSDLAHGPVGGHESSFDALNHWYFSCPITDFGAPGRNKTIRVRVWRGEKYADATTTFDYDNAALRRLALDYLHYPDCDRRGRMALGPNKTIYYLNEAPYMQDLIDYTLREYIGPRAKLNFLPTQDERKRPLIVYVKNDCCGVVGWELDPKNPYASTVAYLGVDAGPVAAHEWLHAAVVCHETGHALGLPHDAPGYPHADPRFKCSCMTNAISPEDPNCIGGLRLHPYQQKALQMLYAKPPGTNWCREQ